MPVLVGVASFERGNQGVAFVLDLTERKRAEEARRRVESYLTEAQRLSRTGNWAFNAGGFDYWSSECFRIHGLEPSGRAPSTEEFLRRVHPDDREFVVQLMQKMLADPCGFDFTKRIVRPDGEIRSVRCVGSPVKNDSSRSGSDYVGSRQTLRTRIV
jgi:PAS domain-containing protein